MPKKRNGARALSNFPCLPP